MPHSSLTPVSFWSFLARATMRSRLRLVSAKLRPSGAMSRSWKHQNGTPELGEELEGRAQRLLGVLHRAAGLVPTVAPKPSGPNMSAPLPFSVCQKRDGEAQVLGHRSCRARPASRRTSGTPAGSSSPDPRTESVCARRGSSSSSRFSVLLDCQNAQTGTIVACVGRRAVVRPATSEATRESVECARRGEASRRRRPH